MKKPTFTGWYTAASGGSQVVSASGTITTTAVDGYAGDGKWKNTDAITLYAQFSANCHLITLNNTSNGGTGGTTQLYKLSDSTAWYTGSTCASSTAVTSLPTAPTKNGYAYAGHYNTASGTTNYITSGGVLSTTWTVTAPATIYAKYSANTVTATFDNNTDNTCTYDGTLNVPSPETRTGYVFLGWNLRDVPSGYTQLQYVYFNGVSSTGSYVDTGLVYNTNIPNNKIRFQADVKLYQGSGWQVIVGGQGSTSGYIGSNSSNVLYCGIGNDGSLNVTNPYHRLFWDADAVAGTVKIQDKETGNQIVNTTFTPVAKTNAIPILIGGYRNSSSLTNPRAKMDLYNIKIYNHGELAFNGIPARRDSDSAVGLYDTVSNTFKTNASGSAALTAGPVVP